MYVPGTREISIGGFLDYLKPNKKEKLFGHRYELLKNTIFEWPPSSTDASLETLPGMDRLYALHFKWRDGEFHEVDFKYDLEVLRCSTFDYVSTSHEMILLIDSANYRIRQLQSEIFVPELLAHILTSQNEITVTAHVLERGYLAFWNRYGYSRPPLTDRTIPRLLNKEDLCFESDAMIFEVRSLMLEFHKLLGAGMNIHPVVCYGILRDFEERFRILFLSTRQTVESDFGLMEKQPRPISEEDRNSAYMVVAKSRHGLSNRELAEKFSVEVSSVIKTKSRYKQKCFSDGLSHDMSDDISFAWHIVTQKFPLLSHLRTLEQLSFARSNNLQPTDLSSEVDNLEK